MRAFQFAEDGVDVEDARFGELFFSADEFFVREFDADFEFRFFVLFEESPGEVPDLAYVGWDQVFGEVVAADEGFVFGGARRQWDRE